MLQKAFVLLEREEIILQCKDIIVFDCNAHIMKHFACTNKQAPSQANSLRDMTVKPTIFYAPFQTTNARISPGVRAFICSWFDVYGLKSNIL